MGAGPVLSTRTLTGAACLLAVGCSHSVRSRLTLAERHSCGELLASANLRIVDPEPKLIHAWGDPPGGTLYGVFEAEVTAKRFSPRSFIACTSFDLLPEVLRVVALENGYRSGTTPVLINVAERRKKFYYEGILVGRVGDPLR